MSIALEAASSTSSMIEGIVFLSISQIISATSSRGLFYTKLYTPRGGEQPVGPSWEFPDFTLPTEFPPAEWILIAETLPPNWQKPPSKEEEAAYFAEQNPPAQGEQETEEFQFHFDDPAEGEQGPASTAYLTAGHGIIRTIMNLHRHRIDWKRQDQKEQVGSDVWGIGAELHLRHNPFISVQQEVEWRMHVYDK
jgi:hypothetical protein